MNNLEKMVAQEAGTSIYRLRELLSYDRESGIIRWKRDMRGPAKAGAEAGSVGRYRVIKIDQRAFGAHRIAWAIHFGKWPEKMIDHADGNPMNNRISNLRECSLAENACNAKKMRNNTSGYKGVRQCPRNGLWYGRVTLSRNAERKSRAVSGMFKTAEEAAQALAAARAELHGEFARNA